MPVTCWPVTTSIGTESMCAVMIPVRVLVAPGPLVTSTTAGLPVRGRNRRAMWLAPCSWRTNTNFILLSVDTRASKNWQCGPA